jgi:hypothetical protein
MMHLSQHSNAATTPYAEANDEKLSKDGWSLAYMPFNTVLYSLRKLLRSTPQTYKHVHTLELSRTD